MSIDPEVAEIMAEDVERGSPEGETLPLTIIDARGDAPRWESERFHTDDHPELDAFGNGMLAYGAGMICEPPDGCLWPQWWVSGWHAARERNPGE